MEERQSEELNRLIDFYRAEAKRCREARAYLAGCVMLGAALEAGLLAMVECYPDEVRAFCKVPTRKGVPKPSAKWHLDDLLRVAKEMGWLPARLGPGDDFDSDKARIGDWADVVRETRNLIHAGYYVADYAGLKIGKRDYSITLEVLEVAFDWLYERLCESLKPVLAKLEGEEEP